MELDEWKIIWKHHMAVWQIETILKHANENMGSTAVNQYNIKIGKNELKSDMIEKSQYNVTVCFSSLKMKIILQYEIFS